MFFRESSNVPQVHLEWQGIQTMLAMQLAVKFRDSHVQITSSSNQLVIDGKALLRHPSLPDGFHQGTEVVEQRQVGQLAQKIGHLVVALGKVEVGAQVAFNCHSNMAA